MKTTIKSLISHKSVIDRLHKVLGDNAGRFASSVIQLANTMPGVEPNSILNACMTAATLDLSVNKSLGEAWVVPYNTYIEGHKVLVAQFQIGWKGLVQLCMRTNQYHKLGVIPIYGNQFESFNALTEELVGDFSLNGEGKPIGYACYFKLTNGFEKVCYWSMDKITSHAKKYSKTYGGKSKSPWNDAHQFDAMAMKTVLKNTLGKWGPKSIKVQTAIIADQSVQTDEGEYQYIDSTDDNGNTIVHVSDVQTLGLLKEAKNAKELSTVFDDNKAAITKDVELLAEYGRMKKTFEI